ncbi:helix-turn-helix domain-containing protein [Sporomusa aerivorans]|uniref:helix-turn-helix domain-containing protein n=1 Tax=Sporomusa aerivorans TaxID=204936 RepID=UPI00352AF0F1
MADQTKLEENKSCKAEAFIISFKLLCAICTLHIHIINVQLAQSQLFLRNDCMILSILAERLKYLREHRDLKLKEVSQAVGITPSAVGSLEHGRRPISVETLIKMSNFYGVSTDWLLGLTDNPKRN